MWTFTFRRHPKSTPKIMKKYLPNHSKINKKSMLEAIRDWVQFFLHLGAVWNRSFNVFSTFQFKMGPKMDPKINKKSIPRPPGLSEGPLDGPRSLQDSILDWLSMIFWQILEEFWHDFITILERFFNNSDTRVEPKNPLSPSGPSGCEARCLSSLVFDSL